MANLVQLYKNQFEILQQINQLEAQVREKKMSLTADCQSAELEIHISYQSKKKEIEEKITQIDKLYRRPAEIYSDDHSYTIEITQEPDLAKMTAIKGRIDAQSSSDPNGKILMGMVNGALKYYNKQLAGLKDAEREEVARKVCDLQACKNSSLYQEARNIDEKYTRFFQSPELKQLTAEIQIGFAQLPLIRQLELPSHNNLPERFLIASCLRPFPVPDRFAGAAKSALGSYFHNAKKCLITPLGAPYASPGILRAAFDSLLHGDAQKFTTVFLASVLANYQPYTSRVVYLDGVTQNTYALGIMQDLAGNDSVIQVPAPSENYDAAASKLLDWLVNAQIGTPSKKPPMRFLLVKGYPNYYSAGVREKLRTICANHISYNIFVVLLEENHDKSQGTVHKDDELRALSSAAMVTCNKTGSWYAPPGKGPLEIEFLEPPKALGATVIDAFRKAYAPKKINKTIYDIAPLPTKIQYGRHNAKKMISVPIGINRKGQVCNFVLDHEQNPFCYLMGGTGSGKTSLLHIIITNLIAKYHPDDVELWLADFNLVSFKVYAEHTPPHIKYLLLDKSRNYCYSFLDTLTQELRRREKIFFQYGNCDDINKLPPDVHMPVILVIMDEFDILSSAIADDPDYKLILQNLITKGRKFGFCIIFSTQSFTKGITGLGNYAKDNIPVRMAMRVTGKDEIKETLSLPERLMTPDIKAIIDDMKPYHVLYKYVDAAGETRVEYVENLFFAGEQATTRNLWIDNLQKKMHAEAGDFLPSWSERYIDKKMLTVTTMKPETFKENASRMRSHTEWYKKTWNYVPGDMLLYPGKPYSFSKVSPVILRDDFQENILTFCRMRQDDVLHMTNLVCSVIRSAQMDGAECEIWAGPNDVIGNRLPQEIQPLLRTEPQEIAQRISELSKNMDKEQNQRRFVAILDMARFVRRLPKKQGGSKISLPADMFAHVPFTQQEASTTAQSSNLNIWGEPSSAVNNPVEELELLLSDGSLFGIHFMVTIRSNAMLRSLGFDENRFNHVFAFRMASEDAGMIIANYARAAKNMDSSDADTGVFVYSDREVIQRYIPYNFLKVNFDQYQ